MVHLQDDSEEIKLHLGETTDIDDERISRLIKTMRTIARTNMIDFDIRTFGKHIEPKNYAYEIEKNKEQTMSDVFNEGLTPLSGSSRTSRQTLENVKLIVKHRNPVNEEQRGSRSRNISAIFIENADGERFKYPHKHLNGARAMARHVAHGGVPSDMVGEAIVEHSTNLSKLKEFMNVVNKQGLVNENNRSIVANVKQKMESIKESIKRIQGAKGYTSFVESMALNEKSEETEIAEDTVNDYVAKFTKSTFEESLKDILPLVHRVNEEETENNRSVQTQRVASIIESETNTISFRQKSVEAEEVVAVKKTDEEVLPESKLETMAQQFNDLAETVDVDTTEDTRRKNKGHDRAAQLSSFLNNFATSMRNDPQSLDEQDVQLAGQLLKMSKQTVEHVEENTTLDAKFDEMLGEAFSEFDIPE